jgi:hypothetical protein
MAAPKAPKVEVSEVSEVRDSYTARNTTDKPLYLTSGVILPGKTGKITAAERSNLFKYIEVVE